MTIRNRPAPPAVRLVVDPLEILYAREHVGPGQNYRDIGANTLTTRLVVVAGATGSAISYALGSTQTFPCIHISNWDAAPIEGVPYEIQSFSAKDGEVDAYDVAFEILREGEARNKARGRNEVTPH
ncbi:MAG: hypothetical protein FJ276_24505 [Planctomycetes bacterium]|nr:hypothetical protein [Planctomycetota bacterium]